MNTSMRAITQLQLVHNQQLNTDRIQ